jgi:hypothetical protein
LLGVEILAFHTGCEFSGSTMTLDIATSPAALIALAIAGGGPPRSANSAVPMIAM